MSHHTERAINNEKTENTLLYNNNIFILHTNRPPQLISKKACFLFVFDFLFRYYADRIIDLERL